MPDLVESRLAELWRSNAHEALATLAVEAYGPELYGFLMHTMKGSPDAADVLSQAIEDFWRTLPGFRGQCSVRTWLYLLARNRARRHQSAPANRGNRTGDSGVRDLVAVARSRTAPWQQTDVKDRWREIRNALDPDDRALLVLRVDRGLDWKDIARINLGEDAIDLPAPVVAREAARLRKRFQLLKEDLRDRARAAGLLDEL